MPLTPRFERLETRTLLSGVTIITHGQGGSAGGDVAMAADIMAGRAGGAAQFVMTVAGAIEGPEVTSFQRDDGSPDPNTISTGEIIIKLDWSDVSIASAGSIGEAVADFMALAAPDRHRLIEQEIALVGPSRGAPIVSSIATELGRRGIWVDQLTFLDPVPVPLFDNDVTVPDNVVFADNYWRADDNLINDDFDGRPIDGAHNTNLTVVQENHTIDAHASVAAYYIATIDPDQPLAPPALSVWFESPQPGRSETGFHFSRIAGGERPADGVARSHGGTAEREPTAAVGAQWSNVDDLRLLGGNFTVPSGQWLGVSMRYGDRDSRSTVSLYLDRDRNPFNGNTVTRLDRRGNRSRPTAGVRLAGSTVEATPGDYFLYAQIKDRGHVRYSYLNRTVTITSPTDSDRFASLSGGALTARGTSGRDRLFITSDGTSINATRGDFTQTFRAADVQSITIDAGAGDDFLVLGPNVPAALLLGGLGRDVLVGSAGNDTLSGGASRDRMIGGAGDDILIGSGGNDLLVGVAGADRLRGGAGRDTSDRDSADMRVSVEAIL